MGLEGETPVVQLQLLQRRVTGRAESQPRESSSAGTEEE